MYIYTVFSLPLRLVCLVAVCRGLLAQVVSRVYCTIIWGADRSTVTVAIIVNNVNTKRQNLQKRKQEMVSSEKGEE